MKLLREQETRKAEEQAKLQEQISRLKEQDRKLREEFEQRRKDLALQLERSYFLNIYFFVVYCMKFKSVIQLFDI